MTDLFPHNDYGSTVLVLPFIENVTDVDVASRRVIIVIGEIPPQEGSHFVGSRTFDVQVVCVL